MWEHSCLLEPAQGKNTNGNMFALARELAWNPDFADFDIYFVTTVDTDDTARERLALYGIPARTVIRGSDEYDECLARCKFLFTDNSFPPYLDKRQQQAYVNTWHGTPLKQLGHSNIQNSVVSISNVQKNMLTADVVLFPNELTKRCFFDDYKLKSIFAHKIAMADYPRNDALSDAATREVVREREGLEGKRVVAYMPTWRGTSRSADIPKQVGDLQRMLAEVDRKLGPNTVFYVNLHFLLGDALDYDDYEHVKRFPGDYETYDFLATCDALVTDYSSVFFDFAVTGRNIVLYPYDRDEYLQNVGTYFPYDDLPFPVAMNADELVRLIEDEQPQHYEEFQRTYCAYHNGHASKDLLETVCLGKDSINLLQNDERHDVSIRYIENFSSALRSEQAMRHIIDHWPDDGLLVFLGGAHQANADFLQELPSHVEYLSITKYRGLAPVPRLWHAAARRCVPLAHLSGPALRRSFAHEWDRLMPGVKARNIHLFDPRGEYFTYVLGSTRSADCTRIAYSHDVEHRRSRLRRGIRAMAACCGYSMQDPGNLTASILDNEARAMYYNRWIQAKVLTRRSCNTSQGAGLRGIMLARLVGDVDPSSFDIQLAGGLSIGSVRPVRSLGTDWLLAYELFVPAEAAPTLPTQSAIDLVLAQPDGLGGRAHIEYSPIHFHQSPRIRKKPFLDESTNTAMFYRHSGKNLLYMTIRQINPTDYPHIARRVTAAYLLSKIKPEHDAIVLFEKNASRYEESASVVYEKLIDAGYSNAKFILDDGYEYKDEIPQKYRANIVSKGSLEHYRLFFSAKTFIGSEMLVHSVELNTSSKRIAKRLADPTLNYVFLQHGVMYMVSLDSESRTFFKPRTTTTGKFRVVTSSQNEKRHFTDRGKYKSELLYVCGLPKFDRNTWSPDADRIVIMPTWRPWEANAARIDFRDTTYYRFLERIVDSIPGELMSKVTILAHPLFQRHAENADFPLKHLMDMNSRYDDILRETKVLITDYSSIAYDAFYRGANVVFYWSDKDDCMAEYGASTTLMINDDTAFGDVCYTTDELASAIVQNYERPQAQEHIQRYGQIVQFHDGKNTERLIEMMKQDEII